MFLDARSVGLSDLSSLLAGRSLTIKYCKTTPSSRSVSGKEEKDYDCHENRSKKQKHRSETKLSYLSMTMIASSWNAAPLPLSYARERSKNRQIAYNHGTIRRIR